LSLVIILVALMGFANALCWPAIWPMALQDFGGYTNIASAILIMGIIGGAIPPLIYGALAANINAANLANDV
jgi:FHS family L-fucose permease-like MFS transporter